MNPQTRPGPVVDDLTALIGGTPLVRLGHVVPEGSAALWAKCEQLNPGGSVKDRICLRMIDGARADGRLAPGQTVVEPTSGNTGIGLALVCAVRGHPLVLTMPKSMSLERRQLLEAYGAEIVLTDPERVMDGALEAAEQIAEERGAFLPQQFENPDNPDAHAETTAVEILEAFDQDGEEVHGFVAAVGTGGTITGVGRVLKARSAETLIVAVEPEASPVLAGGAMGPSKIQGINAGFVPKNYDPSVVDRVAHVGDQAAWDMKLQLARTEGLLVGISAGANVAAAARLAAELGPDKNVVTILCDTGERYFSLGEFFE
ncbi:MAG: cysteine synthase A [Deltaproteobacteria bacterium]|nr:MAG: cysteine synthase A [Deltaproteobacteria bacterium]